ncbi:MAG: hypothetical protein OXG94_08140 [Bacteroidetes bacterium]|nr:hypothetical protein [Bacteroidota bacterium]
MYPDLATSLDVSYMVKRKDIAKFVVQIPRLTADDQRMVDRDDFPMQVDLAKDYLMQFHVKEVDDGQWFQAYSRKHQAEKYHRRRSPTNRDYYISDTAFCVAHLMLGGKLEMRDCGRIEPIRMAFIGRRKMNDLLCEPSEYSSESSNRRDFWEWTVSLPTTDNPLGDFVQDTKDIYESESWHPEPGKEWWEVCSEKFNRWADGEVYAVYQTLAKKFQDYNDRISFSEEPPQKSDGLKRKQIREIVKWVRWLIPPDKLWELKDWIIEELFLLIRGRRPYDIGSSGNFMKSFLFRDKTGWKMKDQRCS